MGVAWGCGLCFLIKELEVGYASASIKEMREENSIGTISTAEEANKQRRKSAIQQLCMAKMPSQKAHYLCLVVASVACTGCY